VFGWAAFILVLLGLVLLHGVRMQTDEWRFSGFTSVGHNDYNSYLAWMRQAADGHLLFRDLFTTEPHGRVFFHPLFWLMGTAGRVTGAPFILVWQVVMAGSIVLLCAMFYRLAAEVTRDRAARLLFLALATTAAGMGWLKHIEPTDPWTTRSIDRWMPEANGFAIMSSDFFTLSLGVAFMIGCFIHTLRHIHGGHMRQAVYAGLYALALAMTHQYDMVPLYAVLGIYGLTCLRQRWKGGLVILGMSLPYCLYSVAVVKLDPVFAIHTQAKLEMPTMQAIVLGYGLMIPLAILGIAQRGVWREYRWVGFLVTWLVVGVGLLCVPLGFQRKFLLGLHVPMCLLGAMGVIHGVRYLGASIGHVTTWRVAGFAAAITAAACSIGNMQLYVKMFSNLTERATPDFVAVGVLTALQWLDEQSNGNEVVVCSSLAAPLVPGKTGCTVFAGHWAQTVDEPLKFGYIRNIFTTTSNPRLVAETHRVFQRNRVRFVMLDAVTRSKLGVDQAQRDFVFTPLAREVYRTPWAVIWEVNGYERGDDSTPWPSGDWKGGG